MSSTATSPTATTSTTVLGLTVDRSFINTLFGRLCLATLLLNIINFICIACQWNIGSATGWFYFVCSSGFWFCLFEILILMCGVQNRIQVVPWKLGYLIIYGLWAFFYLTAASSVTNVAVNYSNMSGYWACAFFGFIACIVYGAATYFRFMDWNGTRGAISSTNQPA